MKCVMCVFRQVMKLFELCLNSRGDLSKSERKELIGSCVASVIATGFPPDDDDWPLIIDPDVLLPHWDCNMALQKILHTAFPLARTQATEFLCVHEQCHSVCVWCWVLLIGFVFVMNFFISAHHTALIGA